MGREQKMNLEREDDRARVGLEETEERVLKLVICNAIVFGFDGAWFHGFF